MDGDLEITKSPDHQITKSPNKKGGDGRPLFPVRESDLPLLAALFLAALGCFLRHCLSPPLRLGVLPRLSTLARRRDLCLPDSRAKRPGFVFEHRTPSGAATFEVHKKRVLAPLPHPSAHHIVTSISRVSRSTRVCLLLLSSSIRRTM